VVASAVRQRTSHGRLDFNNEGTDMERERAFAKEIASLENVFNFLDEFFRLETIDNRDSLAIQLVTEELFTNLVKYNTTSTNPVVVGLERDGKVVNLELVDRDVDRFDPAGLPEVDVDAPMSQRQPGGLGLHLVRAIVDKITFEYAERVMRIHVVKKLETNHA
jgi:anti-sigma regulatory factor (Ser/Thr protein kinase)